MKFETHQFTSNILNILEDMFPSYSEEIFENSPLLIYLNRTYALLFIDFLWQQMILIENKFINKVLDNWFK